MEEFIEKLKNIEDKRQTWKIKHSLSDVVALVIFATLANIDEWEDIEMFGEENEDWLKKYLELSNGIPSHDTIQRVMQTISPAYVEQLCNYWHSKHLNNEHMPEEIKDIIAIDGKAVRGSGNINDKAAHIVSAWSKDNGLCLGSTMVQEKTNEITAIPELLDKLNVRGQIVTIDAMGTQTKIAEKIIEKKADYVLSLKGNQSNLMIDVSEYFEDDVKIELKKREENYSKTIEKSHGRIEIREYYQTDDIKWIYKKESWKNLRSIIMEEKTIETRDEVKKTEVRYFISSLKINKEDVAKAVRGHWSVENSLHWQLDVTFREDNNKTINKTAVMNMNIIRKMCLTILKDLETRKKRSLKKKRSLVGMNPEKYITQIFNLSQIGNGDEY